MEKIYLIIAGKLSLLAKNDELIGEVTAGDSLGEEGYFEVGSVLRKESACGIEDNTYVMELTKEDMLASKRAINGLDWFTFQNYTKKQWV